MMNKNYKKEIETLEKLSALRLGKKYYIDPERIRYKIEEVYIDKLDETGVKFIIPSLIRVFVAGFDSNELRNFRLKVRRESFFERSLKLEENHE